MIARPSALISRVRRLEEKATPVESGFVVLCTRDGETPAEAWARENPDKPLPGGDTFFVIVGRMGMTADAWRAYALRDLARG